VYVYVEQSLGPVILVLQPHCAVIGVFLHGQCALLVTSVTIFLMLII